MPTLEDKIKDLLENAEEVQNEETELDEAELGTGPEADNAKINAGKGKKLEDNKVTGSPSTDEPNNKKNDVRKNPVGEHVEALVNGEDLSEDFKLKAATILEAAIAEGVKNQLAELEEEYETRLQEAVAEVQAELVEHIDGYLTAVVEAWVSENEIALESGIKNDILEGFVDGLKNLFKEHYIEVPEEKLDVLDEQAETIEKLTKVLDESVVKMDQLQEEIVVLKREKVMESVASTLVLTDREKFKSLCEGLSFTSDEEYAEKLKTIKENHFPKTKPGSVIAETDAPVQTTLVEGTMSKYVQALSGPLSFKR